MHLKQLDVKNPFLNSLLLHEVWVRFPAGYRHPSLGTLLPSWTALFVAFARLQLTGIVYNTPNWWCLIQTSNIPFLIRLSIAKLRTAGISTFWLMWMITLAHTRTLCISNPCWHVFWVDPTVDSHLDVKLLGDDMNLLQVRVMRTELTLCMD